MADVAVFHPYLDTRGGGEAICMRVIEAIQNRHTLTVYTLNDPDVDRLNEQFNTNVSDVRFESLGLRGEALRRGGELVRSLTRQPTRRLQAALSYPYVDRQGHDLVVSTYNEFGFDSPSVQYIDFPNFGPEFESESDTRIERIYGAVCNAAHRGTREQIRDSTLLTNSRWSADRISSIYGTRPRVVYPPVDCSGFDPLPWDERESGFVSIGRADAIKRPLRVFDIVDTLVDRGHDVHLHWIGAVEDSAYGRRVRERAANSEAITLEGRLSFAELSHLVSTHKYGLHGRVKEHFGIVVAEMLAGGALPFVHDSGGQREIVGESDKVLYRDVPDAVRSIQTVLEQSTGSEILAELPDPEERFGLDRFYCEIRDAISEAVDSPSGA